ncbi:MAG: methyltransferase domain-containing protein [Armatimonadota bacterium]|nr:methyltransferase domain-containing protein [Armatimonadota bacterium]
MSRESHGRVIDKRGRLAAAARTSPLVLELGCGPRKRHPSAIGVDVRDFDEVDVVGDVYDVLACLPDAAVDAVYSYHFVEHLSDLARFVGALRRIVKPGGHVTTVAPHFSNPYYYSDYTHRTVFGLYSFSYLSEDHLFRRRVPRYEEATGFDLVSVRLGFKAAPPFYLRHVLSLAVGWLVNVTTLTQEIYERSFCYLFPCYEVEYVLQRRD